MRSTHVVDTIRTDPDLGPPTRVLHFRLGDESFCMTTEMIFLLICTGYSPYAFKDDLDDEDPLLSVDLFRGTSPR